MRVTLICVLLIAVLWGFSFHFALLLSALALVLDFYWWMSCQDCCNTHSAVLAVLFEIKKRKNLRFGNFGTAVLLVQVFMHRSLTDVVH